MAQFRRPAMLDPRTADEIPGDIDPAERSEAAHTSAQALVGRGRAATDPGVHDRLVSLVDDEGLELVAALWADSPPDTLPGALWRLYLVREWIRRDPRTVADRYELGAARAVVDDAVAGVARPPGPEEVCATADEVLRGVFVGELDLALDRAAALCRVLATGAAMDADWVLDNDLAGAVTRRAGSLAQTGQELARAARLYRRGQLD